MIYPMLDNIHQPTQVRALSIGDLIQLSEEIRSFLIQSISKTGGHIGTALGVVELTCAIHHTFDLTRDRILFDTGHQGYTHKLLTGRKHLFPTLNQAGGMSRFLTAKESEYDLIEASHAGTALSIAVGMSLSNTRLEHSGYVVVIVGDGALVEGMSMEALNFGSHLKIPLIIILNDNGMAIPENIGGIKQLTSGDDWQQKSRNYFTGIGYQYIAVPDGHELPALLLALNEAQLSVNQSPVLVHVKTEKGHGLKIAASHPYKLHFSMPFDPETGSGSNPVPPGLSYAGVSGDTLYMLFRKHSDLYAITPSTPYASGLDACLADFPDRTIDVGMAEQHAAGMAAGLALQGKTAFLFYQATFMQRAFDQLFHEFCFMNLPVTVFAVRSGFAGFDSATHHGIYDLSYLRSLPNMQIFYAGTSQDLVGMMEARANKSDGPMIVLYPYGVIPDNENKLFQKDHDLWSDYLINRGENGIILSVGNTLNTGDKLRKTLALKGLDFAFAHIRWMKPLQKEQLLQWIRKYRYVITTEENIADGGFGGSIAELIMENELKCKLFTSSINLPFVDPGDKSDLILQTEIDHQSIFNKVASKWPEFNL